MIESNAYLHFKNKKLKKTDKLDTHFKKMILIDYKDHSIYYLYDRKTNLIFIFCSIDINENSMLKKIISAEVKIKSFTVESAELINHFINSFTDSFINSFTDFSQNDEFIIKSIIKNVAPPVRAKDKKKMSNSSS